jgi:hypothetical protein
MPDVSINGSSIIMAQAVDGAWYAYVADADSSNLIDSYYVAASAGTSSGAAFGKCNFVFDPRNSAQFPEYVPLPQVPLYFERQVRHFVALAFRGPSSVSCFLDRHLPV